MYKNAPSSLVLPGTRATLLGARVLILGIVACFALPAQAQVVHHTAADLLGGDEFVVAEEYRMPLQLSARGLPVQMDVDEDGALYVLGAEGSNLLVIDRASHDVRRVNLAGRIPLPIAVAVRRDTILIASLSRPITLHLLDGSGSPLERRPLHAVEVGALGITAVSRGWLIEQARTSRPRTAVRPEGPLQDTVSLMLLMDADPISIKSYPGPIWYAIGRGSTAWSPVLSPRPQHAIGRNGTMYFHPGGTYQIEATNLDGTVLRRITAEVIRIPLSDRDTERAIRNRLQSLDARIRERPGPSELTAMRDAIMQHAAAVGRAQFRPILGSMHASADGHLMVERLDLARDPHASVGPVHWDIYGPDGLVEGTVVTRHDFRIMRFEWPRLYGYTTGPERTLVIGRLVVE